ncbi:hypothetical protein [Marinobacter sp. OP 3.4]|uniref:hypothetical protein n=1 Tax=Marinobacter sp. OP 3.4 TaxID=3076501 RepID=UPI002E1CA5C7
MPTPSNIVLRNLTTPPVKGLTSPFIATAPDLRDGTRSTGPNPPEFTLSATSNSITATITQGNGADSYEIRVDSGEAVSGLTVTGLTAEQTYSVQLRGYIGEDAGAWSDPVDQATAAAAQGLIFEESFDGLPDHTSSQPLPQGMLDAGWTNQRHGEVNWSPSNGYPDHHDAYMIKGDDPEQLEGGVGKSYVHYRESYDAGWNNWNADGILTKWFDDQYPEMLVRYWIKFQPGWTSGGQSKIVRFRHLDAGTPDSEIYKFFTDGNTSALFQTQWGVSQYGLRNFLAFRGDPQESNYYQNDPAPIGLPRPLASGDLALNFDNNIRDGIDGVSFTLLDRTTGQVIQPGVTVTHDMVYGAGWNKVELYAKMNSAPGMQDGVGLQWVNDQLCFANNTIAWMGNGSPGGLGWNCVDIGGNAIWRDYPNDQRVEEWYAISRVEVHDSLPTELYNALPEWLK